MSLELQVISTDSALRGFEQGESRVEEGRMETSFITCRVPVAAAGYCLLG